MLKNLALKGIKSNKLFLFPNWVDINEVYPIKNLNNNKYIKKLSIKNDQIVLMYSGSINKKQGINILLKLIEEFKGRSNILWIIAGPSYGEIKSHFAKNTQIQFAYHFNQEII